MFSSVKMLPELVVVVLKFLPIYFVFRFYLLTLWISLNLKQASELVNN